MMITIRPEEWLPPSLSPRDLDESPLVRAVLILVVLLWWLGVALFELQLVSFLVAVYAFFLTFSVSMLVVASYQLLRDYGAIARLRALAHI